MILVRDGDGPGTTLLWLIADPRKTTGHGHLDFTSFQLWIRGIPLILDTSGYGYRIETIDTAERAFYYSPFGHSLLTVDDCTPVPMEVLGDPRRWWGRSVGDASVERAALHGLAGEVVCSHRSYPGMTVRRTFRFDLAAGWLDLEDRVVHHARPAGPRTYEQRFFTGFGLVPKLEPNRRARVRAGDLEARCAFRGSIPLELTAGTCPPIERAAAVFGYGRPFLLTARGRSAAAEVRLGCRLEWTRNPPPETTGPAM
jgi:hypothetical protein